VAIFKGEGQTPEFLARSPTGAVPALELADGRVLTESNAILTYLAEGTRYLPSDAWARAQVFRWMYFPKARLVNDQERLYGWFEKVRDFVLLPREALELPIDIQGTAFQSRVWRALRDVPLGKTVTYGDLARRLGEPKAVRAVASACARNQVALLIPCHRAVAADGSLAGYRWGVQLERHLLDREAQAATGVITPTGVF